MAGVYNRYVTDRDLYQVQKEAQSNRRGLWADPAPMLPWEWRRGEGAARVRVEIVANTDASGLSGTKIYVGYDSRKPPRRKRGAR
jgi:hypothetical protein